LELLGICERQIVFGRPAWSKVNRRLQTPAPAEPKTIGEHIHKKRKKLVLQQWQLAKQLGVWRATLGSWEANHYVPEGEVRDRVVAWLGFDPQRAEMTNPTTDSPRILVGNL